MSCDDTLNTFHSDVMDAVAKAERNGMSIVEALGALQVVIHGLITVNNEFVYDEEQD